MGLIKAALGAAGGVMADQWKEYFYCESIPESVMAVKGLHRVSGRSSNYKGSENIISNGSVVAVADGQCMIIVDQGKVTELCAEPGEFVYNASTEPSIFSGELGTSILDTFKNIGKRFTFGGEPPKDQRVYYFNTKELIGNKYGTPSPVPFRVVDQRAGIDIDIAIRCFGEYSYRICDPILFYTNVCGNVGEDYTRDRLDGQLKTELLTALQPAFAKISDMGIRYSALPGHTMELADALNEVLSGKWRNLRGLEIVSFGVSSVKASEEDEQMLKEMQRNAAFMDPTRAAAHLVGAQAAAMQSAASNQGAGPAMAFMGMNMAGQMGGMNAQGLYQMSAQQQAQQPAPAAPAAPANGWTCSCGQSGITGNFCPNCGSKKPEPKPAAGSWKCPQCGATATGKFCPECGTKKPEVQADGWTCSCGAVNKGKFCAECGKPKPAGVPQYKCDKCGWEPSDPAHPPKFCPECGDPFDDGGSDVKSAVKAALITLSAIALLALAGCSLYRLVVTSQIKDGGRMENPDAYRAGKDLVEFEWRQNHRNYYSSFSLKFYQENDMPLLTGWFPSQSGGDEIRESQTDAFSNPIPWQLTWVQWFALQNVLAESELPEYRKPSDESYDETDSKIWIVWRTDDGEKTQTLSGSQAEALEALVLGIAEEAYAASKLETEQREVRETAELVGIYWEQNASSARDCFSFLLDERTLPSRAEKQMLFSYRYQDGDGKPIFRQDIAVEPEKAQACFSSIGQELRALELPVYHPSAGPDGAENSCISATWQDGSEVFTNNYCGESAQSIFTLLVAFAGETEAGIFSRPVPDGGWKCPACGMPNGSSVFCAECGARRPAE